MVFDNTMPPNQEPGTLGPGPRLVPLKKIVEDRGTLIAADAGEGLPFVAARYFLVQDVPPGGVRAQHAQREGHELISCVAGSCTVEVWWRAGSEVHTLDDPAVGLYLPPWAWVECREFSGDAVLLVLCSDAYEPLDQISDFDEFLAGPGEGA
jgi:UDP-2-acetamido-3-amino-2,3-dideoxy-glucuronate N-acetyltransferase